MYVEDIFVEVFEFAVDINFISPNPFSPPSNKKTVRRKHHNIKYVYSYTKAKKCTVNSCIK